METSNRGTAGLDAAAGAPLTFSPVFEDISELLKSLHSTPFGGEDEAYGFGGLLGADSTDMVALSPAYGSAADGVFGVPGTLPAPSAPARVGVSGYSTHVRPQDAPLAQDSGAGGGRSYLPPPLRLQGHVLPESQLQPQPQPQPPQLRDVGSGTAGAAASTAGGSQLCKDAGGALAAVGPRPGGREEAQGKRSGKGLAVGGSTAAYTYQVFDPEFKCIYDVPSSCVVHLPPARLNITRLVLCRNYRAHEPWSCGMGHNCKFVHADCDYASLEAHPIHVNYIWRDESCCTYPRLADTPEAAKASVTTIALAEADGAVTALPLSRVLLTDGALVALRRAAAAAAEEAPKRQPSGNPLQRTDGRDTSNAGNSSSGSDSAASEGGDGDGDARERPASAAVAACAWYDVGCTCPLGERCQAIHRVTVDPNVSGAFKRANGKSKTAAAAVNGAGAEAGPAPAATPKRSTGEDGHDRPKPSTPNTAVTRHSSSSTTTPKTTNSHSASSSHPASAASTLRGSAALAGATVAPPGPRSAWLPSPSCAGPACGAVAPHSAGELAALLQSQLQQLTQLQQALGGYGFHPVSASLAPQLPSSMAAAPSNGLYACAAQTRAARPLPVHGYSVSTGLPTAAVRGVEAVSKRSRGRGGAGAPAHTSSSPSPAPGDTAVAPPPPLTHMTITVPLSAENLAVLQDGNSAGTVLFLPRGSTQACVVCSTPMGGCGALPGRCDSAAGSGR